MQSALRHAGEELNECRMIQIHERSLLPIFEQIVSQIKELIAKGALAEGDKIPSVRELSAMLLVNHNTVAKAYQELERQGVIVTVRGKGAYVAKAADAPGMLQERLTGLREQLRRLVVEAHHLGIGEDQLKRWVEEEIGRYRREEDAHGLQSAQDD
jgi:GntR family transcriptional regulator